MTKNTLTTEQLVDDLRAKYGDEINTAHLRDYASGSGISLPTLNNRLSSYKVGRGKFNLSATELVQNLEEVYDSPSAESVSYQSLVPEIDEHFVPFGNFKDVKSIIKSGIFYPVFITGLSGNGKTHSIEQACAQLERDCIRVNITSEVDEDDLIGGFRLVNGETVFHYGPVVEALQRGAILLLDEVDLASSKIMCLQPLLEGKGVYLKKVNQYIKPAPGFNVMATANTRGKGDDTGNFIGTNLLNEAFLERFAVTFIQDYPTQSVEKKILTRIAASVGSHDEQLIDYLCTWAHIIRATYNEGGVDSVITTRRLINIIKAFAIWNDVDKAIQLCINRFDDETSDVFLQLFNKIKSPDYNKDNVTDEDELNQETVGGNQ